MLIEIEAMKNIIVIQFNVETVIPKSEEIWGKTTITTLVTILVDNWFKALKELLKKFEISSLYH